MSPERSGPPSAAAGLDSGADAHVGYRHIRLLKDTTKVDFCQDAQQAQALADVVAVLQRALVRLRGAGGGA
jgi:hypothetical protein